MKEILNSCLETVIAESEEPLPKEVLQMLRTKFAYDSIQAIISTFKENVANKQSLEESLIILTSIVNNLNRALDATNRETPEDLKKVIITFQTYLNADPFLRMLEQFSPRIQNLLKTIKDITEFANAES